MDMKVFIRSLLLGGGSLTWLGGGVLPCPGEEVAESALHQAEGASGGIGESGRNLRPGTGVVFGVMPTHEEEKSLAHGVLVERVAPGSPAGKAGLRPGDRVLRMGKELVENAGRMRQILATFAPGDCVPVEVLRGTETLIVHVQLVRRPGATSLPEPDPGYTDRGDRVVHTVSVSPEIRERMREIKGRIRESLHALPEGLESREVIRDLQELRNLARDANPSRQGWMVGRAGEALLQFHDEEGTLVLHGVNNLLTLEVYDASGMLRFTAPLNTREQCRALPKSLLERLHRLH